jgi:acrylyl-CoA reductase (NADPH)
MNTFPAWLATKTDDKAEVNRTELTEDDLMAGDVTIRVEYSALNYKDGLAMTNPPLIIREFPLIPGIDLAGIVEKSDSAKFKPGDRVALNGFGVGENFHGGYAAVARVKSEWLVPLPDTLSTRQAMAIGTAGYTAMLCIMALEQHGITPDSGKILVTGAAGGVGSVAVSVLNHLGYDVSAATGRSSEADYLQQLGANEVIERAEFSGKPRPLARERWAGAIDVAGGITLANVLSQIQRAGAVAACGLAESMDLPTSVAPFILRGVTLYGIDSVMCPIDKRITAWNRLANELDLDKLELMSQEIGFDDIPAAARAILKGEIRGRTIVKIPH